jgi:outer membrane protein assembly factor BamB
VPVLDDFSQARLVWVNEQDDLGYAKATSGGGHCYPRHMKPSGCGSLIVAGGLVIAGYFHPTDNVSSTNRATDTNAAARNVGKAPSKNAAGEGDPFAASGKEASATDDGDAEGGAGKGVPPPPQAGFVADDIVVAVDAATGKTRWKQVYKGKGLHRPVAKHPNYGPIPAAGDGPSSSLSATTPGQAKVFHLGSGALVYGLDLATGKPLWETGLGEYRAKLEEILARNAGKAPAECSAEIAKEWPWLMIAPLQVVEKTVFVTMGQWFMKEKHNPSKNEEEKAMRQVRMLFALDADTGKILWNMRNAISEGTTVCAAEVGGKTYVLAAGEDGFLRLLRPRTGEVVWQEYLGVPHRLQPIVAGGRAFVMGARVPQPGVLATDACLAVYALSESGAKRIWQSEFVFRQVCLWTPLAYRNSVIYAGLVPTRATPEGEVLAFRAEDGQILGRISGSYLFHLWGDRLVRPGDVNHESMGAACTYTAVSGDLTDLALSGTPFAFRNQGPYKGVCGYEVLMHHPFVDGYLFTRAVDCVKGKGVILCWDVRATGEPAKPAPGKQAEPKGMTKGRSNAVPMRQEGAPAKKDTPPPDVGTADLLEL